MFGISGEDAPRSGRPLVRAEPGGSITVPRDGAAVTTGLVTLVLPSARENLSRERRLCHRP